MRTKEKKAPNPNKFGTAIGLNTDKVKSLMDSKGLSCPEVAERGNFHSSAVHRYYRGDTRFVRPATLVRLAAVLGVRKHELESGEEYQHPTPKAKAKASKLKAGSPTPKPAAGGDGEAILCKAVLRRMWATVQNHGGMEDLSMEDQLAVLKAIMED